MKCTLVFLMSIFALGICIAGYKAVVDSRPDLWVMVFVYAVMWLVMRRLKKDLKHPIKQSSINNYNRNERNITKKN